VGDHLTLGDVKVHVVPAMHSSEPSGRPVGFVVEFADGRSVYHEGDTWIFGDMALIQEFYHPNIILMPVGAAADGQSPRMAWIAVTRYFKPQVVIPMHYDMFERNRGYPANLLQSVEQDHPGVPVYVPPRETPSSSSRARARTRTHA
jgi:L-ascorbate metabolism protein UlaG (beta-lactamase superfamily)